MRIVIVSNAPFGTSAYAGQTRSWATRLKALGHDVAILATFGLYETIIEQGGIRVYPCGLFSNSQDMLSAACRDWKAHVMFSLLDPHVFAAAGRSSEWSEAAPWVPWTPIDCDPPKPATVDTLDWAHRVVALTHFGEDALKLAGVRNVSRIPHGLETDIFKPMDKEQCRKKCGLPAGAFIVGFVGVNKEIPSRKGLDAAIMAFAEFKRTHKDAYLYLHTLFSPAMGGMDIPLMAESLGLWRERDWCVVPPFQYLTGQIGPMAMARLYNSFDVLLAPSMSEGFGLPLIEAQACGVPVISTRFSAMPENTVNGICVESAGKTWVHGNSWWAVPDVPGIARALEIAYDNQFSMRSGAESAMGVKWAQGFDWNHLALDAWKPLLEELEAELC